MDQKRAMLYPQVDFNSPSAPSPTPTRELLHPMGLPVEAPPSYDVAVAVPALPAPAVPVPMVAPPSQPVIVVQPGPQPPPTVVQTPGVCVCVCAITIIIINLRHSDCL